MMIKNKLGKSGLEVSVLGLGTAQFGAVGYDNLSQEIVDEILSACIRKGINFIDTAREYGESEAKIGSFLKRNPNSKFIILTKITKIQLGMMSSKETLKEHILKSLNKSLSLLNIKQIDLVTLHQMDSYLIDNPLFWEVIKEIKATKLFKSFGISVYETEETRKVVLKYFDIIDVVQCPFSVVDQRFKEIFHLLKEKNIGVVSRSVFLQGLLLESFDRLSEEFPEFRESKERFIELAKKYHLTPTQLALRYSLSQSSIHTTLCGTISAAEWKENIEVFKDLSTNSDLEKICAELAISNQDVIDPRRWKKYKIIAILQARMGSTRLPGKTMKDVLGKPIIGYLLERLSHSKHINKIIVATPQTKADDVLCDYVRSLGYSVFRGSELDVLDRFYQLAMQYRPEIIVRLTADCPLIDYKVVDEVIQYYLDHNLDYVSNINPPTFPNGLDTEVFSFQALIKAWQEGKTQRNREHVTTYIYESNRFKLGNVRCKKDLSKMRWTLDYPEDFVLISNVLQKLYKKDSYFDMNDVLNYRKENPDVFDVNQLFRAR